MGTWKRCSTCKKDIAHEATYYLCNVSTCRKKRTGMVFCTMVCWEAHLPLMRHREAWAEEEKAPTASEHQAEQAAAAAKAKGGKGSRSKKNEPKMSLKDRLRMQIRERDASGPSKAATASKPSPTSTPSPSRPPVKTVPSSSGGARRVVVGDKPAPVPDGPREILVVASRLKNFIREVYDMNTSDGVLEPLSEEIRRLCVKAVAKAKEDGRKTLLERDFD